ncbi:MAG: (Fe-S)-binding protein [Oleiphilaceae bacterium]|nr:(Fe-S)-binding protein [Oleiphilaceae bacterium]
MHDQRVYLFGTCLIDQLYPKVGMDALALLELCGYQVEFPLEQTCCGQPPYNSGYREAAFDVAKNVIKAFSQEPLPVVVPSASCAGMIKHHYAQLMADTPLAQAAQDLAARCVELVDFIADKLPYEQLQQSATNQHISLHLSCSSLREVPVAQRWRDILTSLPGVTVSEPENAEECCGFGGTFAVKSPEISACMTADKAQHLSNLQSEHIVSGDCGCLMNIGSHLKHQTGEDPCVHIATIIAQAFGVAYDE